MQCEAAIPPSHLIKHRTGESHYNPRPISHEEVNRLVLQHNLIEEHDFVPKMPFPAVPRISWSAGYICSFPGCSHCMTSHPTITHHVREKHEPHNIREYPAKPHLVQSIFGSYAKRYAVTAPLNREAPINAVNDSRPFSTAFEHYLEFEDEEEILALQELAQLTVFLTRYPWLSIVEGQSPHVVSTWVSFPNEQSLNGLYLAMKNYFSKISLSICLLRGRT